MYGTFSLTLGHNWRHQLLGKSEKNSLLKYSNCSLVFGCLFHQDKYVFLWFRMIWVKGRGWQEGSLQAPIYQPVWMEKNSWVGWLMTVWAKIQTFTLDILQTRQWKWLSYTEIQEYATVLHLFRIMYYQKQGNTHKNSETGRKIFMAKPVTQTYGSTPSCILAQNSSL